MQKFDTTTYENMKATGNLPSPKGAALAIIRLTQKENLPLTELDKAIRADPAFVGRLIKAANLANISGARAVVSVREALMVLGIPAVRTLALGFSLLSQHQNGRCPHFDFEHFWSHSLVTAIAFQTINIRTRAAQSDEAFSLGLLSHIGELGLATLYPEKYDQVLVLFKEQQERSLTDREHEVFFIDHARLTGAMLSDWGLPDIYVNAAILHERPDEVEYVEGSRPYQLCHSLNLAVHIANICLAPAEDRKRMVRTLYRLAARLSIEADSLDALCDEVIRIWPEWASMLNLRCQKVPSLNEIAMQEAAANGPAKNEVSLLRLLVVDDDKTARLLVKAIVEAQGYEVLTASNGEEAFQMAVEYRPDIVITDWTMPGMSGVDLTRALRQTKDGRNIYIVLLTALDNEDPLVEAFEAGVDDFISKPLRPKVIAARLNAGRRMISLQRERDHDHEELRRFADELSITNRRLHEMAMTDVLTSFPNRRYAIDHLSREWAASDRTHRPLSCLIIDVDDFKPVNDAHGHDVGDMVLQKIATAISTALRAPDVVCRLGGDEFIAICPDTALDAALACAERVRLLVERTTAALKIEPMATVSIGVATRDPGMAGPGDLIKRADEGTYAAKQDGRNRVGCMPSSPTAN